MNILCLSRMILNPFSARTGRYMRELHLISLNLYASLAPSRMLLIFMSHFIFEVMTVPSGWMDCMHVGSCLWFPLVLIMGRQYTVFRKSTTASVMCCLIWGPMSFFLNFWSLIELILTFHSSISIASPSHLSGFPNVLPPIWLFLWLLICVLWVSLCGGSFFGCSLLIPHVRLSSNNL